MLDEEIEKFVGFSDGGFYDLMEQCLKEMFGYQFEEVIGGVILGVVFGVIGYFLEGKLQLNS